MKKIISCSLLVLLAMTVSVKAQTNELKVVPGYKFSWSLSLGYNFDINIIKLKPDFTFDWSMGNGSKGQTIIKHEALMSAKKLVNYFSNGDTVSLVKATTVILSNPEYDSLKAGKPVNITSNDTLQKLTFVKKGKMNVLVDGKDMSLDILYGETNLKHKYWIWDNKDTPLIFKMDIGWTITIKSITTKK